MPTPNQRVNIVTNKELHASLSSIAKLEDMSLSAVARELIIEALEKREDRYLSDIANARDSKSQKTISHDKFWKD